MQEIIARKLIIEIELDSIKADKLGKFTKSEFFKTLDKFYQHECESQLESMIDKIGFLKSRHLELTKDFTKDQLNVLTKGEEIIGRFNFADKREIDEIKLEAITLINTIDSYGQDPRRKATANTDIEKATMMAVKSLF